MDPTMRRVWTLVSKMFKNASKSKMAALRVRDDNPASDVCGPDRGIERAKAFLYPSEMLQLMSCEAIPLQWRRMFALTVYLYVRAGEIKALRWSDIDLERGIVNINRGIDRSRRKEKSTKGRLARRFAIEPNLLLLLRSMQEGTQPDDRVLRMRCMVNLAQRFRKYLQTAGLNRPELFADDGTRKHITFHDLRSTGISWRAVRGDDPLKIQACAGHTDFATTQRYVRQAALMEATFEPTFPPLPACLLGGGDDGESSPNRQQASEVIENTVDSSLPERNHMKAGRQIHKIFPPSCSNSGCFAGVSTCSML
jgi:integrase